MMFSSSCDATWVVGQSKPRRCAVAVSWDATDPTVLQFEFSNRDWTAVRWFVPRESLLLAAAAAGLPMGRGDLAVRVVDGQHILALRNDKSPWVIVSVPSPHVDFVLDESINVMCPGSDDEAAAIAADLDSELESILGGRGSDDH